jgi:hypothetical protein
MATDLVLLLIERALLVLGEAIVRSSLANRVILGVQLRRPSALSLPLRSPSRMRAFWLASAR